MVLGLPAPQRGLPVDADGPEGRLALSVGRQLGQLGLPGQPVSRWMRENSALSGRSEPSTKKISQEQ